MISYAGKPTDEVEQTQVCVVGGGVLGCFTALSLAERGLSVVLVERRHVGSGASSANPGTVALQNKHLGALPLAVESLNHWERVSERLGTDVEYERRGGFRLAESEEDLEKLIRMAPLQRTAGVNTELVERSNLLAEAPYLDDSVQGASYCPDDGMADSLKTMRGLLRRLIELGVTIWDGCEVVGVRFLDSHDVRVDTDRGSIRSEWVVTSAGGWTKYLLASSGIDLPLTFEIMIASITDQSPMIFPHVLTHARGHLTLKQQNRAGKVLIGGGWNGEGDPKQGVHSVAFANLRANLKLARTIVPRLGSLNVIRCWSGIEGRSPDRLLVVGPVPERPGLFVLCTAAGGFTISPLAGELSARWIVEGSPGIPMDAYHVKRFLKNLH